MKFWCVYHKLGSLFDVTDPWAADCRYLGPRTEVDFDRLDDRMARLAAAGATAIVLDLAEGLVFRSMKGFKYPGAVTPRVLNEHIRKWGKLGLRTIPMLGFSAAHCEWMGEHSRMIGSSSYYDLCRDVIRETSEIFEKPSLINIGMDAMVAYFGEIFHAAGYKDGFKRALARAVLGYRINRVRVVADGKVLSRKYIMQATLGNGKICGGEYLCSPHAVLDDGLMEVCVFKTMLLLTLIRILPKYRNGQHLDDDFCRHHLRYTRAKHVELSSDRLIYLSLDGETIISSHFNIDVLDKAVNLILPAEL